MKTQHLTTAAILIIAIAALATRLTALDNRPMHGDEANQAHKTGVLIEDGVYRYDPHEHHGPTMYYFARMSAAVRGETTFAQTTEVTYRIIPVIFSAAAVALLLLTRDALGNAATIWAALFATVSTAITFYSRYYIQETLLVFFTFACIAAAWRFYQTQHYGWAVAAGAAAGLMQATKETCIIAFAAMAGGLVFAFVYNRIRPSTEQPKPIPIAKLRVAIPFAIVTAIIFSVVFFSSFFTHPRGILDSVLTYANYLGRGAASEAQPGGAEWHRQPWHYYLSLLAYTKKPFGPVWTEGLILGLAGVGAIAALAKKDASPLLRFLTAYTVLTIAAYSVIPYKTPWNALSMLHACTLLAGFGAATLIHAARYLPLRIIVTIAILIAAAQLARQAYRANTDFNADPRNPYVYAHTSTSAPRLGQRADELAQIHDQGYDMTIQVIAPNGDYWPLPWYLRKFENVGYWPAPPEQLDSPIIVTSPIFLEAIENNLQNYEPSHYSLRPGVILLMYVEEELWEAFMQTRR
jgi:uncharacterized protein (TIGR03663 family)